MMHNASIVNVFTLSGLEEIIDYRGLIFSLTLLCYCMIIMINIVVFVTVATDKNLHEPMYILLCNLCINGLYGTLGFYPKFLLDILSRHHSISYSGCLIQALVIYSSVCVEASFLTVMAYDRYVAICRPLEYHAVMTKQWVTQSIYLAWIAPFCVSCVGVLFTYSLTLCGSHIDKLYCAFWVVAKLSCVPTSWATSTAPLNTSAYVLLSLYCSQGIYILCSYVQLIKSIMKSLESRGKFVKTCVPHLLATLNLTSAAIFDVIYMRYGSNDLPQSLQNLLAITLISLPALFNPLIYGLALTQIRSRILFMLVNK